VCVGECDVHVETSDDGRSCSVTLRPRSASHQTYRRIFSRFSSLSYRLHLQYHLRKFGAVLPSTVLVINVKLVREVRRASHSAAANLGLQQSTASNSAIPTVMLITTSLVYVFLMSPFFILWSVLEVIPYSVWCDESWRRTHYITAQFMRVTLGLVYVVYAYNFFVYVIITSKQFRCELRQLCCCASSSSTNNELAAAAAAVRTPRHRAVADV